MANIKRTNIDGTQELIRVPTLPAPRKPRKVKVALYVVAEIDIDELEAEYGQSYTAKEAAADGWAAMFNAATTAAYPADRNDAILKVISTNSNGRFAAAASK